MPITIKDIAQAAHVSVATVSLVLSSATNITISAKTAEKVRRLAREMQYRPNLSARNLRSKQSNTIGMVIHGARRIEQDIVLQVEHFFHDRGYDLILGFSHGIPEQEWRYIDKLYGTRVDGFIVFPTRFEEEKSLEHYRRIDVPMVLIDGPEVPDIPCVKKNRAAGVKMLLQHLSGAGRRRIAISLVREQEYGNRERLAGYFQGLAELGLPVNEELVLYRERGEFSDGAILGMLLERRGQFDAVLCGDDYGAVDLISGLLKAGVRVPEEMAVVGFFDRPFSAEFKVPLTTLRQDREGFGRKACEFLLTLLELPKDQPPALPMLYAPEPELVIRESCGALVRR